MEQSVVFSPSVPDRELDKQVNRIDKKFDEVDETIQPEVDTSGLDGVGSGISDGQGVGGGGMGQAAGAGGVAGLASKIPKPVGGVTVGAALPVVLGGSVGVGMLQAMKNTSARLQTSSSLLKQAWNNIWRPIGDRLDELFIRDAVKGLVDITQDFEENFRNLELPEELGLPGVWAQGPAAVGQTIAENVNLNIPDFSWPDVGGKWMDMGGWPDIAGLWPGFPDIQAQWTGWPDIGMPDIPDWSDASPGIPDWRDTTPGIPDWRDLVPGIPDWSDLNPLDDGDSNTGGDEGDSTPPSGGGDDGDPPSDGSQGDSSTGQPGYGVTPTEPPGLATGGRVERTGVARVHKGEMVGDRDKLISELADAIGEIGGGGGGGERDFRQVVSELQSIQSTNQQLRREVKRLAQALKNQSIEVDGETFGRLSANGQQNHVIDSHPGS